MKQTKPLLMVLLICKRELSLLALLKVAEVIGGNLRIKMAAVWLTI